MIRKILKDGAKVAKKINLEKAAKSVKKNGKTIALLGIGGASLAVTAMATYLSKKAKTEREGCDNYDPEYNEDGFYEDDELFDTLDDEDDDPDYDNKTGVYSGDFGEKNLKRTMDEENADEKNGRLQAREILERIENLKNRFSSIIDPEENEGEDSCPRSPFKHEGGIISTKKDDSDFWEETGIGKAIKSAEKDSLDSLPPVMNSCYFDEFFGKNNIGRLYHTMEKERVEEIENERREYGVSYFDAGQADDLIVQNIYVILRAYLENAEKVGNADIDETKVLLNLKNEKGEFETFEKSLKKCVEEMIFLIETSWRIKYDLDGNDTEEPKEINWWKREREQYELLKEMFQILSHTLIDLWY